MFPSAVSLLLTDVIIANPKQTFISYLGPFLWMLKLFLTTIRHQWLPGHNLQVICWCCPYHKLVSLTHTQIHTHTHTCVYAYIFICNYIAARGPLLLTLACWGISWDQSKIILGTEMVRQNWDSFLFLLPFLSKSDLFFLFSLISHLKISLMIDLFELTSFLFQKCKYLGVCERSVIQIFLWIGLIICFPSYPCLSSCIENMRVLGGGRR